MVKISFKMGESAAQLKTYQDIAKLPEQPGWARSTFFREAVKRLLVTLEELQRFTTQEIESNSIAFRQALRNLTVMGLWHKESHCQK